MAEQAQLDVVINSIANTSGFATAKAEMAAMGGGFSPLGGGNVNFGGSLTREEQTMAAAQMRDFETATKGAAVAERDFFAEGNAAARAMGAIGVQGGEVAGRMTALGGLLGSSGGLGIGVAAAIVGIGGAALALKSMGDIADADEAATRNLANAFADAGRIEFTKPIDDFINANAAFIPSIAAVKDGFASLVRAGFDETMSTRIMNDALDLAAAKHIDLTTAVTDIIMAENGQSRALLDLGISVKQIQDPVKELEKAHKEVAAATKEHTNAVYELQKWEDNHRERSKLTAADLLTEQHLRQAVTKSTTDMATATSDLATAQSVMKDKGDKAAQILDQIETKTKNNKEATSDLQQSQNKLNTDWQKFAEQYGPGVNKGLGDVLTAADGTLGKVHDFMDMLSNSGPVFDAFDGWLLAQIKDWQDLGGAIGNAVSNLNKWSGLGPNGQTGPHYRTPTSTTMTLGPTSARSVIQKVTRQ